MSHQTVATIGPEVRLTDAEKVSLDLLLAPTTAEKRLPQVIEIVEKVATDRVAAVMSEVDRQLLRFASSEVGYSELVDALADMVTPYVALAETESR